MSGKQRKYEGKNTYCTSTRILDDTFYEFHASPDKIMCDPYIFSSSLLKEDFPNCSL